MTRTALYRHFDADGGLLYVGVSLSALARLAQHRDNAEWYASIAHVQIEWFDDRAAALHAERLAIRTERPKHNVKHRMPEPPPSPPPPPPTVVEVMSKPSGVYILPNGERAYTIDAARELLANISRATMYRLMKEGKIKCWERGNKKLITEQHLSEFIESCRVVGG